METINSRVREIRKRFCKDSNTDFANRMRKRSNTVNNWVRDGYSVGRGVIADILREFPEVNEAWLKDGVGDPPNPIVQTGDYASNVSGTHQNRNCGSHSGNYGTINYNSMGKDELVAMMEERFHYLQQKENEILRKDNHIDQIWEENRNLTATVSLQVREQSKCSERIHQLNIELREREREIAELRAEVEKFRRSEK